MPSPLETLVWRRARDRCEYCQLPQSSSPLSHEIDHIIPRKHRGKTTHSNLALACFHCNHYKGTDFAGFDPKTGKITMLFNPRRQKWTRHFRWSSGILVGRTAVGRVTIDVLSINEPDRVILRETLISEGDFPPEDIE